MDKSQVQVDDVLADFDSPVHIGGGGQKQVYRATHSTFGEVTVKIGVYTSDTVLERISREVGLLRSANSKYFPKQFMFEPKPGSRYCIVEELINGAPLEQHLSEYTIPNSALQLLSHLVRGMSVFWIRRVVHRDLKPANIMITDSNPRIIDLGIARIQDASSLTFSFAPLGPCTPNYASPEQLTNRKRYIDHRSDQFTLGIVLGQLLLGGMHPFDPVFVKCGNNIPENILQGAWERERLSSIWIRKSLTYFLKCWVLNLTNDLDVIKTSKMPLKT